MNVKQKQHQIWKQRRELKPLGKSSIANKPSQYLTISMLLTSSVRKQLKGIILANMVPFGRIGLIVHRNMDQEV